MSILKTAELNNSTNYVIPEGIEVIAHHCFLNSGVESVTVPESVKIIEPMAFANCYKLENITLPGVQEIGQFAFINCKSLQTIFISKNIKSIGGNALSGCSAKIVFI